MATKKEELFLPIKQVFFDEILSGTKKKEYREIKDTTFKKYLDVWTENGESGIDYDDEKITDEDFSRYPNDPMVYNGGVYPYYATPYKRLKLAVGYRKDRDILTVEVKKITFEPMKDKKGNIVRFDVDMVTREDGDLAFWQVVYHLGKVISADLKKDRV